MSIAGQAPSFVEPIAALDARLAAGEAPISCLRDALRAGNDELRQGEGAGGQPPQAG